MRSQHIRWFEVQGTRYERRAWQRYFLYQPTDPCECLALTRAYKSAWRKLQDMRKFSARYGVRWVANLLIY